MQFCLMRFQETFRNTLLSALIFNSLFLFLILYLLLSQVIDLPSPHLFGCKTLPQSWIWPQFYNWIGFIVLLPGSARPLSIWFRYLCSAHRRIHIYFLLLLLFNLKCSCRLTKSVAICNIRNHLTVSSSAILRRS